MLLFLLQLSHLGKAENFNSIAYFESLPDFSEGDLIKLHVGVCFLRCNVFRMVVHNSDELHCGHLCEF